MRRLVIGAVLVAAATTGFVTPPASAICRPWIGPICEPCWPNLEDPLPWYCPL